MLSQGSAEGADSGISSTVSCAATLDQIICGKLVLQAALVSHLLRGHMLNTIIVTLNGCRSRWMALTSGLLEAYWCHLHVVPLAEG